MLATGITPDFVIVDGSEGGTGAAPQEFEDHVGMPLTEGLMLVHNALVGAGLRDRIRDRRVRQGRQRRRHRQPDHPGRRFHAVGAGDDVRGRLHPGAEMQHQPLPDRRGHPGPARARALDVPDKTARVVNFQRATVASAAQIVASMGLDEFRRP